MNWFVCPLLLERAGSKVAIMRACCSSALWQICQTLYLLFRMQKCRFTTPSQDAGMQCSPWGMGYSLICLRFPDPTNPHSETSTQLLLGRGAMTHLSASCWQWGDRGWGMGRLIWKVVLVSVVDPCSLQGPPIEQDGGLMHRQRWVFLD
jgi:hypothetical protein